MSEPVPPAPATGAPRPPALGPPPLGRMVVAVLALVGLFVSFYLLAYHLGWLGQVICGVGDCATVQASRWAYVGPVPVPVFGVLGYLVLLVTALVGLQPGFRASRTVAVVLLGGATAGFLFSLWLTYLEAFVIHAWCQWCVVSAVCMTLIFFATLPEIRLLGGSVRE